MKRLLITGLALAFFGGTALADCDYMKKAAEMQQEMQRIAINDPQRFETLTPEMEKWADELSAIADEQFKDPQRLNKLCLKYDAMLKTLREN